jgi:hypothetical protein
MTNQVAQVHRHGDGIAAGFSQGRRHHLDDPESQRHLRDLGENLLLCRHVIDPAWLACSWGRQHRTNRLNR